VDHLAGQRLLEDLLGVVQVPGGRKELPDRAIEPRRAEVLRVAFVQQAALRPGDGHAYVHPGSITRRLLEAGNDDLRPVDSGSLQWLWDRDLAWEGRAV